MLEKFAPEAVALIDRATQEARDFGHAAIGIEHFLLAFSQEGTSTAAQLSSRGLDRATLAAAVERMFGRLPTHDLDLRFSPEIKDVFVLLRRGLQSPFADQITTDAIFQAIMEGSFPTVFAIYRGLNLKPPELESALVNPAPALFSVTAPFEGVQSDSPAGIQASLNSEIALAEGDFTEAANYALLFARVTAANFNFASDKIDPACLLVGLCLEHSGWAGKLLRKHGVTVESLRSSSRDSLVRKLEIDDLSTLKYDSQCRRLMQAARKEARKHKQELVTSVHLLWAILSSGPCEAKTWLAQVVEDLAELKADLTARMPIYYEGNLVELELNQRLFNVMLSRENPPLDLPADAFESRPQERVGDDFDLRNLSSDAQLVMEHAFHEFTLHRFTRFEAKHILLGLLAAPDTVAARYLHKCGLSLKLVRRKVAESDKIPVSAARESQLDAGVSDLLSDAFKLACEGGFAKAGSEHLLAAIMRSKDTELQVLLWHLGVDQEKVLQDALALSVDRDLEPFESASKFARISSAGLHIYGMICEPAVAAAVQLAVDETKKMGVNLVSPALLLLGLLRAPGLCGNALWSFGLTEDMVRDVVVKTVEVEPSEASELQLNPLIEDAFYQALTRSLQKGRQAVASEDVLYGMLKLDAPDIRKIFVETDVSPQAVLDYLQALGTESSNPNKFGRDALAATVERVVALSSLPLSSLLQVALHFAVQSAVSIGGNVITSDVLLYALSFAEVGPTAEKMLDCGLSLDLLRRRIITRTSSFPGRPVGEPQILLPEMEIFKSASAVAGSFEETEVQPSHLLIAILQSVSAESISAVGVDQDRLNLLLLVGEPVSLRAQQLQLTSRLRLQMNQFDFLARSVLAGAAVRAVDSGRNFIGQEHLFLAIICCRKKNLRQFLLDHSLGCSLVEDAVARYCSRLVDYWREPTTVTEDVDVVLEAAVKIGLDLGQPASVEALLLALVKSASGSLDAMLCELGVQRLLFARAVEHLMKVDLSRRGELRSALVNDVLAAAPQVAAAETPLPSAADSARRRELRDKASTWYNRALMAHRQDREDLTIQALERWWQYCEALAQAEGAPPPEPLQAPEHYFGRREKEWAGDNVSSDKPPAYKQLEETYAARAAAVPRSSQHIDLSIFSKETAEIFAEAYEMACRYAATAVEPLHFMLATLLVPRMAKFVFVGAVDKKVSALTQLVSSRCKPKKNYKSARSLELSAESRLLLEAAFRKCQMYCGSPVCISPEHLLLAILERDDAATLFLDQLAVDRPSAIRRLLGYINGKSGRSGR
ncbi:MAG: hypothetical protein JSS86_02830 [Cyanobacteria bacterium SZAS LIN-2]|nr:hypothetical protein [Cyanobacteria bacterium SZAS LIN-2]